MSVTGRRSASVPPGDGALLVGTADGSLLARLRAGEEDAFAECIARFGSEMLATARRLLANEEDARDAVQEAFLSAFKGLARFDGRSGLGTWLHRIAVNASLMKVRAQRSRGVALQDDLAPRFEGRGAFAEPQAPWASGPEDCAMRDELRRTVLDAVASLPAKHREVLTLRDIEGLSNEDLALELGVSANAARIRVHRARQALRELLAPRMQELAT